MAKSIAHRPTTILTLSIILAATALGLGCTTSPSKTWQSLQGEGFPAWNEQLGSDLRATKNAQPSGHFTDKKSDQIEQNLGGF
jgi:hypothetical protein